MMGLIQKVLCDLIESAGGKPALEAVLERAGVPLDRAFRINENYDDAEWRRLLDAACEVLEVSRERAMQLYAERFLADARARFPTWFELSRSAREFLQRQPAIHNGFYTGLSDAEVRAALRDKFQVEKRENGLITRYRSPNQLCGLYEELARSVLRHYDEEATIEHRQCIQRGDPECEIRITWED